MYVLAILALVILGEMWRKRRPFVVAKSQTQTYKQPPQAGNYHETSNIPSQESLNEAKNIRLKRKAMKRRVLEESNIITQKIVSEQFNQHFDVLLRKRRNLIIKDDYGNEDDSKWFDELNYFYDTVVLPRINSELHGLEGFDTIDYDNEKAKWLKRFDYILADTPIAKRNAEEVPEDGYEYENYCRDSLQRVGWEATRTPGSGDQGADVIAEQSGLKIVVQCKSYESPVGNKAVQEIAAAKAFYGADHAIVVTNQTFTKSAKSLAAATSVILIHHDEIPLLMEKILEHLE